jgi:hypothetical protein
MIPSIGRFKLTHYRRRAQISVIGTSRATWTLSSVGRADFRRRCSPLSGAGHHRPDRVPGHPRKYLAARIASPAESTRHASAAGQSRRGRADSAGKEHSTSAGETGATGPGAKHGGSQPFRFSATWTLPCSPAPDGRAVSRDPTPDRGDGLLALQANEAAGESPSFTPWPLENWGVARPGHAPTSAALGPRRRR